MKGSLSRDSNVGRREQEWEWEWGLIWKLRVHGSHKLAVARSSTRDRKLPAQGRPASAAVCVAPLGLSGLELPCGGLGKASLEQVSIGLMQTLQAKLKVSGSLSSRNSF